MPGSETSMLDLVLRMPEQMAQAVQNASRCALGRARHFDNVVVGGMGGSSISGDLVRGMLLDNEPVPVMTCRDYAIPALVTERTLFVGVSYSGNTEETLSAFRQAARRGARLVAITTGGRLGRMAKGAGAPVVPVPGGYPPRAAIGHLFVSLLVVLERLGVGRGSGRQLNEAIGLMVGRRGAWLRKATGIARRLKDRLPVVYSTSRLLDAVAERWRCELNEMAKVMCHTNALPEHNHNEIVGMGAPAMAGKGMVIIGLLDGSTHARTRLRLKHVLDITKGGYERAILLESEGRSPLARMFSLLMLGDLTSVELARLRGVDPMPVTRIDELKRRMAGAKSGR